MNTASPGWMFRANTAAMASSSQSKGLARKTARCISSGTAECLTTAPSGARLPRRMAMVPWLPMGSS